MCNDRKMFDRFEDHNKRIALAGDNYIRAIGRGEVFIEYGDFGVTLQNVLYSPELQANFISITKAVNRG